LAAPAAHHHLGRRLTDSFATSACAPPTCPSADGFFRHLRRYLAVISHPAPTRLEGRGFSPAAIVAPRACPSRSLSSPSADGLLGERDTGLFRKSL
jgi:hypothetical protein